MGEIIFPRDCSKQMLISIGNVFQKVNHLIFIITVIHYFSSSVSIMVDPFVFALVTGNIT